MFEILFNRSKKESKHTLYVKDLEAYSHLPRRTRKTLERLWEYDLPPDVIKRLKKKFPFNAMPDKEITSCVAEFKKFMAIMVVGRKKKRGVAMTSNVIDEIWHEFILFTVEYQKFSELLDNKLIHHTPNTMFFSFGPDSVKFFYDTYKELFGYLNPIWTYTIIEEESDSVHETKDDPTSLPVLVGNKGETEINYGNLVCVTKYQIGKKQSMKKSAICGKITGYAKGESKSGTGSCGGMIMCGLYTTGFAASEGSGISDLGACSGGDGGGCGGGCGGCGG